MTDIARRLALCMLVVVLWCFLAGCVPDATYLARNAGAARMVVDESHVVVASTPGLLRTFGYGRELKVVAKRGGSPKVIHRAPENHTICNLDAGGGQVVVYICKDPELTPEQGQRTTNSIVRIPTSGGREKVLETGDELYVYALVLDGDQIFYALRDSVRRQPLAGGPSTVVAELHANSLAVDSRHLHGLDGKVAFCMPKQGGPVQRLTKPIAGLGGCLQLAGDRLFNVHASGAIEHVDRLVGIQRFGHAIAQKIEASRSRQPG